MTWLDRLYNCVHIDYIYIPLSYSVFLYLGLDLVVIYWYR